jgi:hypothetical protein
VIEREREREREGEGEGEGECALTVACVGGAQECMVEGTSDMGVLAYAGSSEVGPHYAGLSCVAVVAFVYAKWGGGSCARTRDG